MAAYERASSEAPAPTLDLVEGLAGALLGDARPQRAVEVGTGAEGWQGVFQLRRSGRKAKRTWPDTVVWLFTFFF